MEPRIEISPEKWKFICAALQATGTLDLVLAFKYLTNEDVQKLAAEKKGIKKECPLYHTDSQPNDLVRFIELMETEGPLCEQINMVIQGLYQQAGYEHPLAFDTWKAEFLGAKSMGRSISAMKAGTPLKALIKIIKDHISITAPQSKQVVTVQPEIKVIYSFSDKNPEQTEKEIFLDSLEALRTRQFQCLDPVTGDASCEMRVPFLLDVHDMLMTGPLDPVAAIDTICPFADITTPKGVKRRSASRYLGLCKPLTIIRTQAKDHFLFLIDDRPTKYKYTFNVREALKADMATYNVDYMRCLSQKYAGLAQVEGAPLTMETMVATMLLNCKIEMSKSGQTQPILPVFTAMRLILMHEIKCGRPIAVALTRIGYLQKNQDTGYRSAGSKVFYYKVGRDRKSYVHVPESELSPEDKARPITVFHAYNMFPLVDHIDPQEENDRFFFSKDWDVFEAGFIKCDITHLIRCWAAAHPPVPKSSKLIFGNTDFSQKKKIPIVVTGKKVALNSEHRWVATEEDIELSKFDIDLEGDQLSEMRGAKIREYIERVQAHACPNHDKTKMKHKLPDFELSCQGVPLFDVTELQMDLVSEYQYYKELAYRNDLYELHYAAETGEEKITCYLDKGTGLEIVSKDDYEKNTSASTTKKVSSQCVTEVTFMRTLGAAAFSPVHVFLSCYDHEAANLAGITPVVYGPQISLCFTETEDMKTEGTATYKVKEDELDPGSFL